MRSTKLTRPCAASSSTPASLSISGPALGTTYPNGSKPTYSEQLSAPGSIRGTEGQHRNGGSRCEG